MRCKLGTVRASTAKDSERRTLAFFTLLQVVPRQAELLAFLDMQVDLGSDMRHDGSSLEHVSIWV